MQVSGLDQIDTTKAHVYAVTTHPRSTFPVLYANLPFQFRIVFKSELLAYPFVGWHLTRSGQVCINQQNPTSSVGSIKSAVKSLRAGMPLVIFPEGGRTPDGEIKPFMPGAFFLAIRAQVDIVPIALVGTFELLPMNTYHIKCQPLEMRVGKPIPTAGLNLRDMDKVSARVHDAIEASVLPGPSKTIRRVTIAVISLTIPTPLRHNLRFAFYCRRFHEVSHNFVFLIRHDTPSSKQTDCCAS